MTPADKFEILLFVRCVADGSDLIDCQTRCSVWRLSRYGYCRSYWRIKKVCQSVDRLLMQAADQHNCWRSKYVGSYPASICRLSMRAIPCCVACGQSSMPVRIQIKRPTSTWVFGRMDWAGNVGRMGLSSCRSMDRVRWWYYQSGEDAGKVLEKKEGISEPPIYSFIFFSSMPNKIASLSDKLSCCFGIGSHHG